METGNTGYYYIASPLREEKHTYTERNERVARKLEKAGIRVYLPQRDTDQQQTPKKIFSANIKAIENAKGIIVVLADTRGIYLEDGYAKALEKVLIAVKLDAAAKPLGTIVRNFFDYVVESTDELIVLLNGLEKQYDEL